MKEPNVVLVTPDGRERRHPFEAQVIEILRSGWKSLGCGVRLLQAHGAEQWALDVDKQPYTDPASFAETVAAL